MLRQVASALRKSTPSVAPRAVFVPLGLRCYSKGAPFRPTCRQPRRRAASRARVATPRAGGRQHAAPLACVARRLTRAAPVAGPPALAVVDSLKYAKSHEVRSRRAAVQHAITALTRARAAPLRSG